MIRMKRQPKAKNSTLDEFFWCSGMSCCWVREQPSHELFFALLSFGGTKESKNPFTGEWMQCYTLKAIASEEEPLSAPLSSRALLRLPESSREWLAKLLYSYYH